MRSEARSIEALLEVLTVRISDSQSALGAMAERLMTLGDEATGRIGNVTREMDQSAHRLSESGAALDRAAESARVDIGVLLEDLPRAESTAQAVAGQLRQIGSDTTARTTELAEHVATLSQRTRDKPPFVVRLLHHQSGAHDVAAGDARQSEVGSQPGKMGAKCLTIGNAAPDQHAPFRRGGGVACEKQSERAEPEQWRYLACRSPYVGERDQVKDERKEQRADAQPNGPGSHSAPA